MADLCEWIHVAPSAYLRLEEIGYSHSGCMGFDLALRAFKRWADARRDAMKLVVDTAQHSKPMKPVPQYPGLVEQLNLNPDGTTPAPGDKYRVMKDEAAEIAAAWKSGKPVDWSQFE